MAKGKKKSIYPFIARQGDVLVEQLGRTPADIEPAPNDSRGIVLAEGESSGHFHAVKGGEAKLFRFKDARAERILEIGSGGAEVRVIGGGSAGVDRHTPIKLEGGTYRVRIQQAWDSTRARQVHD